MGNIIDGLDREEIIAEVVIYCKQMKAIFNEKLPSGESLTHKSLREIDDALDELYNLVDELGAFAKGQI